MVNDLLIYFTATYYPLTILISTFTLIGINFSINIPYFQCFQHNILKYHPVGQLSSLQIASRVENLIALALFVFSMERLA